MQTTPQWMQIIQLLASVAIVGTFFVYYALLKTTQEQLKVLAKSTNEQNQAMQKQLEIARSANMAQNLIALNQVIVEPEFRAARKTLIGLDQKPLSEWSESDRHIAERACGLWNFAALLVLELGIPPAAVRDMSYTVVTCHHAAAELLAEIRSTRSPDYWTHFTRLSNALEGLVVRH